MWQRREGQQGQCFTAWRKKPEALCDSGPEANPSRVELFGHSIVKINNVCDSARKVPVDSLVHFAVLTAIAMVIRVPMKETITAFTDLNVVAVLDDLHGSLCFLTQRYDFTATDAEAMFSKSKSPLNPPSKKLIFAKSVH